MFLKKFNLPSSGVFRKIFSNTSLGSIQSMVEMGGNFAITVVIARMVGVNALGIYIYAKALVALIHSVLSMGMTQVVIRNFAQKENERQAIISTSFTLRLFITVPLTFVIAYGVSLVLPIDSETQRAIWLVAIINSLGNTTLLLNGTFQAVSKFQFPLSLSIVHKMGLLLMAWQVPIFYDALIPVLIGFICVHVVVLLVAWQLVNYKITAVRLRFVLAEWRELIQESLPLAFSDLSLVANGRADSFLLGTMRSVSDVAIYGAAYNLYLGINGVINSLAVGVFPILSQRANASKKSALRLSSRVGLVLFSATAVIAVVGILLSERIILLVYGTELLIAYPIFQILLLAIIFSSLGKLCHFTLISIRLQKLVFWATVTGMIFNITANLILIPIYGYTGAAYITLATELIVFLFSFSLLLRQSRLEHLSAVHITKLHP